MSFIKRDLSIEAWLDLHSPEYDVLKRSEYVALLNNWREVFDSLIEENEFVSQGDKAMRAMECILPSDTFIFNFPGYEFLPASTNAGDKVYAYKVKGLGAIDRELFNKSDSIVCDINFHATCLYTHEWQCLAAPKYFEEK